MEAKERLGNVRQVIEGSESPVTQLQVDVLVTSFELVVALRQLGALMDDSQVDRLYLVLDWFTITRITPDDNGFPAVFGELSQSVMEVGALRRCDRLCGLRQS